jgi:hypothetical protein
MLAAAVGVGAIDALSFFFICSDPAAGLGTLSKSRNWRLTEIRG